MKRINLGLFTLLLSLLVFNVAFAQAPTGYYQSAEGKNKKDLLVALNKIVGPHTTVSYTGLWTVYKTSDVRPGTNQIWDMYSTATFIAGKNQCGSYSSIGDCYNREHSFPKSWFNDASPMYSEAYHIYPTDGKVNGQRSNYPYGECANGSSVASSGNIKALGKLGTCTFPGYTGKVFEPVDDYKGDFARTYFYMAAAYQTKIASWSSDMLAKNDFPCYTTWAINLLLKWHRQDPVSQKEIDRNNAVSTYQKNRNPFIDYPELAEYIWGNKTNDGWVPGGVVDPTLINPVNGTTYSLGTTAVGRKKNLTIDVKAQALSENLSVSVSNTTDFTLSTTTISKDAAMSGTSFVVTYNALNNGDDKTTVTISSKEVSATVTVSASAFDGIPALEATNITKDSFTAHWMDMSDGENYSLNVYTTSPDSPIEGFPKVIAADSESYVVSGLNYSTTYHYTLSDVSKSSNVISVTTADPDRIIAFTYNAGDLFFSALPNESSEAVEINVYTEYITDPITVKIDGPFEISYDQSNWGSQLNMDADGESFYLRMKASATEGTFVGELSASTATFVGEDIDVEGVVAFPRTFLEGWESSPVGGYYSQEVKGDACSWNFVDVGIWNTTSDRFNGENGARFGKTETSSIAMAEDKTGGIGTLSFFAGTYGSDGTGVLEVLYSTDGGENWVSVGTANVEQAALKEYVFPMNIKGNARIKIQQLSGKRLGVDDISLNDYSSVTQIENNTSNNWSAWGVKGGIEIDSKGIETISIYTTDATQVAEVQKQEGKMVIELPAGIYVVASDNQSKKVIVK